MCFDRLDSGLLISLEKRLHEKELGAVLEIEEAVLGSVSAERALDHGKHDMITFSHTEIPLVKAVSASMMLVVSSMSVLA